MAKSSSGGKSADKAAASTPPKAATPSKKIIAPEHAEPLKLPSSGIGGMANPNKRKVYLPPKITPRVNGTLASPVAPAATPPVENSAPAVTTALASPETKPVPKIPASILPTSPPATFAPVLKAPPSPKGVPKKPKARLSPRKKASAKAAPKPAAPARPETPAMAKAETAPLKPAPASKAEPDAVSPVALARIEKATAAAARAISKPAPEPKAPAVMKAKKPETPTPQTPPEPAPAGKRIAFIASECTPLAQTGGLGDVVAGLSKALRKRGHDARIIMPLYGSIDRFKYGIHFSRSCCVHFGHGEEIWVGIFEGKLGDVPIWFVDYERYFGRPQIYDDQEDAYRFAVLSKAALQICKDVNWIPHIAHVHDWMTSLSAVFLKTWDRVLSPLSETASVLTIHNIGYQGKFPADALGFYGLGADYLSEDKFEDFGGINLLKAGIQYADAVTTVSPTYANEIRGPIGGMGMQMYLNNRGENVFGIVNGVDVETWNPATDRYLPARYSVDNMAGKAACKKALQERFGLHVDPKVPLFGIVSRFAPQKGFDLIRGALPQALRDMLMQVVILGTGDPFTESFFRWLHGAHPHGANAHIGFVPELAHLIEAGSDFFLMPSLYEPCGLNQMYSSLYGTLPVVRATGGLDDTVENYDEHDGGGTGFKFWDISQRALYHTIGWAVSTWWDRPQHCAMMQKRGMQRDFTWNHSAEQYEQVYDHALVYHARL
ncbi:MAG TPA: glycogen/starch synthase [Candidatus Methylacidiphilales bacterium]|nr:glycogen/starch synthase [Candidatus Methylacidiphilales bacterium]